MKTPAGGMKTPGGRNERNMSIQDYDGAFPPGERKANINTV